MKPLRALAILPLLVVAVAGCLGGADKGRGFDQLAAPVWEPGYWWKYDVTASYRGTYADEEGPQSDSDNEKATVVMSVFNTTQDLDGEPVYFIDIAQGVDHPLFEGAIQALSQADLSTVGITYERASMFEPASRSFDDDFYYWGAQRPSDPCDGLDTMYRQPAESRFPALRFPLDDGQAWQGTWGETGDDAAFSYTTKVMGLVPVQTASGVWPSVYVQTEFTPNVPDEYQEEDVPFDFRIRSETWYSPDVKYLTKMVLTAQASGRDPDGDFGAMRFDYVSTMELRDFGLEKGTDRPAKVALRDQSDGSVSSAYPVEGYRIVSSHAMPVELTTGPQTVTLGLRAGHDRDSDARVEQGSVPQAVPINHDTHEVVWMVQRQGDPQWRWVETVGDQLQLSIEGGVYQVGAHVRPKKCGDAWLGEANGHVTSAWSATYDLPMEASPTARTIKVAEFPVYAQGSSVFVEWKLAPTVNGQILDAGHPILTDGDGQANEMPGGSEMRVNAYPPGLWTLSWATERATVGDDVSLAVRVLYDPWEDLSWTH